MGKKHYAVFRVLIVQRFMTFSTLHKLILGQSRIREEGLDRNKGARTSQCPVAETHASEAGRRFNLVRELRLHVQGLANK